MAVTRHPNDGHDAGGVTLNARSPLDEYLKYKVTVSGAQPAFTLVETGSNKVLLEANSGTPLQQTYERRWPTGAEAGGIQPGNEFRHTLGMSFLLAVKYRFVVEHYDSDDNLLETLTDVEWSSDSPTTTRFEPFVVNIPEEL